MPFEVIEGCLTLEDAAATRGLVFPNGVSNFSSGINSDPADHPHAT